MNAEERRKLAAAIAEWPICGGIHDAPGKENDLRVVGLARFAVEAHNKNARLADAYLRCTGLKLRRLPKAACLDNQLKFEKLVKVKEQLVAGKLYYLTIEATDGEAKAKKLYEAQVYERPWEDFTELKHLKPSGS